MKTLPKYNRGANEKANAVNKSVNAINNMQGDGLINVSRNSTGGVSLNLSVNKLLERLPYKASGGGTVSSTYAYCLQNSLDIANSNYILCAIGSMDGSHELVYCVIAPTTTSTYLDSAVPFLSVGDRIEVELYGIPGSQIYRAKQIFIAAMELTCTNYNPA